MGSGAVPSGCKALSQTFEKSCVDYQVCMVARTACGPENLLWPEQLFASISFHIFACPAATVIAMRVHF